MRVLERGDFCFVLQLAHSLCLIALDLFGLAGSLAYTRLIEERAFHALYKAEIEE